MFAALINAVIWILLAWWLFPGAVGYVITFWAILLVMLRFLGVGFWEMGGDRFIGNISSSHSSDVGNIPVDIGSKK